MSRNISSILNAVTALLMTLINGLLGIIVTRFVVESYGSDFNGLNSTANQIVNVLLVLEGGFTMASNVAMFAPMTNKNYEVVNGVLAATRVLFRRIGSLFLCLGIVIAIGYSWCVNSALEKELIVTVIVLTVIPAAINLYFATAYRVLLQTQQKEYVINVVTCMTLLLGHVSNIIAIKANAPMWSIRFITMIFSIVNTVTIIIYVKRNTEFLNLRVSPNFNEIKGTNDVLIQKITGVIYSSAPIVFLSISSTGGTLLASVYAVYNSVFSMLKSLLHGVIDAPRLGLGQMLTEKKKEEVWKIFAQYEYIAFYAVFSCLSTGCALIMPFMKLYMYGITDANYFDEKIAILMILITIIEMLHIPSGHLINMAGKFKIGKRIQMISCIALVVLMSLGGKLWGVYGMLMAILVVAILLSILEMGYVHVIFFPNKLVDLLRLLLPLASTGAIICLVEWHIRLVVHSYISFVGYGVLFMLINGSILFITSWIFNRNELSALIGRLISQVRK